MAQRADLRQVGRGGVDRAAPSVGDALAAQARKVVEEVGRGRPDHSGVDLGAALRPRSHRDPAATPAEGDAAVRGGAEVVEQGAAVGDALAAVPADLGQQLGHRLGQDDVRGGDGEAAAQRAVAALGGGADRQHGTAGADDAAFGPGLDAVGAFAEGADRRGLEDLDPGGAQLTAQPERQTGWLDRRGAGADCAGAEGR